MERVGPCPTVTMIQHDVTKKMKQNKWEKRRDKTRKKGRRKVERKIMSVLKKRGNGRKRSRRTEQKRMVSELRMFLNITLRYTEEPLILRSRKNHHFWTKLNETSFRLRKVHLTCIPLDLWAGAPVMPKLFFQFNTSTVAPNTDPSTPGAFSGLLWSSYSDKYHWNCWNSSLVVV